MTEFVLRGGGNTRSTQSQVATKQLLREKLHENVVRIAWPSPLNVVTELLSVTGRLETVLEFGKRNVELQLFKNKVHKLQYQICYEQFYIRATMLYKMRLNQLQLGP